MERAVMTPSTESADSTEKALSADPIENAEPTEPTEPIENAEPTDPTDMNELREPMHSTEFVDRRLRIDEQSRARCSLVGSAAWISR
ncbi:MAG: hypothetical protein KGP12_03020 [Actinomycetales bacterium]|nr:hypothetical protein [Actinomycetales bacterium]